MGTKSENELFDFSGPIPTRYGLRVTVSLVLACGLYVISSWTIKKPISIGVYKEMIDIKARRMTNSDAPRLLIIAGSNARVSHRSDIIQAETGLYTVNGGLSADLSLPFALEAFASDLRAGDVVYLPLEYQSYCLENRGTMLDYYYMVSYDRKYLWRLGWREIAKASASFDLAYFGTAVLENLLFYTGARRSGRGKINEYGDQEGFTEERSSQFRRTIEMLPTPVLPEPSALASRPYGIRALQEFLRECRARNVIAIGGLPTTFEDAPLYDELVQEIREIFVQAGHKFVQVAGRSQYPRSDFYDSPYHLNKNCAIKHSRLVGEEIAVALRPLKSAVAK